MSHSVHAAGLSTEKAAGIARTLLRRQLGKPPRSLKAKTGGLNNLVFSAEVEGEAYIVRLHPDRAKVQTFLKEQWTSKQASDAGVPVPEILLVGSAPVPHMIVRKGPGTPAEDGPDPLRTIQELGSHAATINSIGMHGFGAGFDRKRNQLGLEKDWDRFLRHEFKLQRRLKTLERHEMLPARRLRKLERILEKAGRRNRTSAMNHGDLRLKNALVDSKGRISAILDWENAIASLAPEWELSIALHDLTVDQKEAFLLGYGVTAGGLSEMAPVIKALNVVNYVDEIERLAAESPARLDRYRSRLCGDLDLYSF